MAKRILSMILVVVMLVLSLASCGSFNYAKEDLSKYATMSEAEFKAALLSIVIKDGDFTADETTRHNKVWDEIYSILADSLEDDAEKVTTGVPGAHDLVYYAYYCTAKVDGKEVYLFTDKMDSASAGSIQLGKLNTETALEAGLLAALTGYDFTADGAYVADKSSLTKTKEGDVVFVSYKYSITEKDENGEETETEGTVTKEMMVIGKAPESGKSATSLASYLADKSVGTTVTATSITTEDGKEIAYSSIKIDYIAKGGSVKSFKDITYVDDSKPVKDTNGKEHDLKGKELTYYVYPVSFVAVPEFSTVSLLDNVYASGIKYETVCAILFGGDYAELEKDEFKALVDAYTTKDENDKDVSLENLVSLIAEKYKKYEDALSAVTSAEKNVTTAKENVDKAKTSIETAEANITKYQAEYDTAADEAAKAKAKESLDKAKADKTKAETSLENAESTLKLAEEKLTTVKGECDTALETKNKTVARFTAIEGATAAFEIGYQKLCYADLQEKYNEEIKENLAKEIYYFLEKYITLTGEYPEKAVEENYKQLIEKYEYEFYTGKVDSSSTSQSNYKKYGTFKKFLVAAVTEDVKTVKTYEEALDALKAEAQKYVEPVIRIYVAAKAYGVVASEKELDKAVKEDSYNEYTYGEDSVKYAYQFDLLMDHLLESEEKDGEDSQGFKTVTVEYNEEKIKFTFGDTPTSAEKSDAE